MRRQSHHKGRGPRRHRRVRATVVGTPQRPRLNIFRSLEHIYAQVIDDSTGTTLVSASTIDEELRPQMAGKKKSEQAKLVGQAVAARANAKALILRVFNPGASPYPAPLNPVPDSAPDARSDTH